jgi:hypothetical protein
MKTPKFFVIVLIAAVSIKSLPLLAQNDIKEQLKVTLTYPAKPGLLEVNLIRGSVHVVGYAGKEVIVDAVSKTLQERESESRDEAAKGMKRINSAGNLDLTIEEENNNVQISYRPTLNPLNLTIKVPEHFSLKIGTVNDGDITVDNVNGELEISNVNGAILLNTVSGSAVANTVNGQLKANFKTINQGAPMAFSTLNGNVDVTFPATAKFDLKLKSDRGEIYSDFDMDVVKSQPQTTRSTKDGLHKVSISGWVQGKVNGGGKEVMMKNMNGNIYIRKAK